MPTDLEMMQNLDHAFPHNQAPATRKGGFQLMADEIKLESRMRWDPCTNNILGICHKHDKQYGLKFQSMAQATALRDWIRDDDVHLASEVSQELGLYAVILKFDIMQATVLAMSIFSNDPHLYGACPFVISGTCK